MKFFKRNTERTIQKNENKIFKIGLSVSRTRVVRFMVIALTTMPEFPFQNFRIRYMVLLQDSDARRILNLNLKIKIINYTKNNNIIKNYCENIIRNKFKLIHDNNKNT